MLKGWGDFLISTAGGIAVGALLWFALKQPCQVGTSVFNVDCVRFGDVEYTREQLMLGASTIAVLLGLAVHALRK